MPWVSEMTKDVEAAKSCVEEQTTVDAQMSEWGNLYI